MKNKRSIKFLQMILAIIGRKLIIAFLGTEILNKINAFAIESFPISEFPFGEGVMKIFS